MNLNLDFNDKKRELGTLKLWSWRGGSTRMFVDPQCPAQNRNFVLKAITAENQASNLKLFFTITNKGLNQHLAQWLQVRKGNINLESPQRNLDALSPMQSKSDLDCSRETKCCWCVKKGELQDLNKHSMFCRERGGFSCGKPSQHFPLPLVPCSDR